MAERQKSGKTTWKKYHDSSYQYFLLLQRYSSSTIRRPMLQPLVLHWSPRHAAGLTGMDGTRRWDVPKSPLWLGHKNEIFMYQPQRKSLGKILRDQKAFAAGQAGRWGCHPHTDPHNSDPAPWLNQLGSIRGKDRARWLPFLGLS